MLLIPQNESMMNTVVSDSVRIVQCLAARVPAPIAHIIWDTYCGGVWGKYSDVLSSSLHPTSAVQRAVVDSITLLRNIPNPSTLITELLSATTSVSRHSECRRGWYFVVDRYDRMVQTLHNSGRNLGIYDWTNPVYVWRDGRYRRWDGPPTTCCRPKKDHDRDARKRPNLPHVHKVRSPIEPFCEYRQM
jgi:hypothetical protein